jgi:hypothetical protein
MKSRVRGVKIKPQGSLAHLEKWGWLKALRDNLVSYLYNLGTLILGLITSTILVLNKPSIGIGIFYFLINLLVGSVVWGATHKLEFRKSILPTFAFYAACGACGVLTVLVGDTLLEYLKSRTSPIGSIDSIGPETVLELSRLSFYSLLAGLIPSIVLNYILYVAIKSNIPQMQNDFMNKLLRKGRGGSKTSSGKGKRKIPK